MKVVLEKYAHKSEATTGNSDILCDEFAKGAIEATKYPAAAYNLGLKAK